MLRLLTIALTNKLIKPTPKAVRLKNPIFFPSFLFTPGGTIKIESLNKMIDYRENLQICHEYVKALEDERRKIEMFQRELPLCLELVTQAIETCKQQLSGTTDCLNDQSECSEQTTSDGPVFEEFMPVKRTYTSAQEEDEEHDSHDNSSQFSNRKEKSDWLRSVQLWNQSPDPSTAIATNEEPTKVAVVDLKRNGGAFHPFKKEIKASRDGAAPAVAPATPLPSTSVSSTADRAAAGGGCGTNKKNETDKDGPKKARRCWSPELHRRFLNALQQLGGSHIATPKQIRDLMKVDGLTNDEVKSHLQKYRLHNRRPNQSVHSNANTQAPQFVVVGGIWVPPPEYAAVAAASGVTIGDAKSTLTTAAPSGVYAPVAAAPSPAAALPPHKQSGRSGSHSEGAGGARCNSSPATSSSTHTTTASPAY